MILLKSLQKERHRAIKLQPRKSCAAVCRLGFIGLLIERDEEQDVFVAVPYVPERLAEHRAEFVIFRLQLAECFAGIGH